MTLHVRNTLTRRLETFEPMEDKVVKMYVCGPTVYDRAHIGHAMSAIVFDVIRRYLEYLGYRVIHVMNFTDVDDKIISRANELGLDPFDLAQRYIDEWFEHVWALNLLPAHHTPRVSHVMPQVIHIVRALVETGYAYAVDGDVYYRVHKFADYGEFSGRSLGDARVGARVAVDERKEDPLDFALWKAAKPGEPSSGTLSARRWPSTTWDRRLTSTVAAQTSFFRTTRTRSPNQKPTRATSPLLATGYTTGCCNYAARKCQSLSVTW